MNLTKNKVHRLVFTASAALLLAFGSIMAYFTSTDEITNKFVGSRFDVTLTETNWNPKSALSVVPGDELFKNPQVTNNERTDAYVFLRVTVPGAVMMVDKNDGSAQESTKIAVPLYKFMVNVTGDHYEADSTYSSDQKVNSTWKIVNNPVYDEEKKQFVYVYAYSDGSYLIPLKKGDTTSALFDKLQLWNFNEEFDPSGTQFSQNVRVEALGIQANLPGHESDDINEIWQILSGEGG